MSERKGILIVDDTLAALKLLTDTLTNEGYIVRPASNGERALSSVQAEQPELIILDVRMPGLDGFEVCRRLKEQSCSRDIPILFLSAATDLEERVKGFALGAVDFITKPFQIEEMLARVRTHLQLSRLQNKLEVMVEQRTAELNVSNERLLNELDERKAAELSLKESEKRFRQMIDLSPYSMALSDIDENIEYLNGKFVETFGYTLSDIPTVKKWWILAYPDEKYRETLIEIWKERIDRAFKCKGEIEPVLANVTCKDGVTKTIEISAVVFGDKSLVAFHDVTERKLNEERLKTSLQEKETLLRELYHRTKNNMQVICSLLSLKSLGANDEKLKVEFREMESRIHSMALVHQKLYSSKNLSNINLKEYINDLSDILVKSYKTSSDRVSLVSDIDDINIFIDIAIPLGLIINELISNSLKHAFPDGRTGQITISGKKIEGEIIQLRISDNGIGIMAGFDLKKNGQFGMQTVFALAEYQLHAQISFETSNGLTVTMKFSNAINGERL
ncbi:MAG: hypothetical protein A2008_02435 [Candidatus Wallbacteria bacterium GWC2_49_35]|uniref:histidine kinase n=1 Tax=Candidatus Wallbacteria bacterium GWC2_49_35 TaxID=1817813 RepID=A0A1F7WUH2_9BACT|nr:MAG: hypothetical protein A2008_02435 [Candidatus Wallbacteria bacterium GWC2_49_35]HBC74236.1 hypothetical protein [Candidatus Wallbacteria bacterium]